MDQLPRKLTNGRQEIFRKALLFVFGLRNKYKHGQHIQRRYVSEAISATVQVAVMYDQLIPNTDTILDVLRHGAQKLKLKIRSDGFILLEEVLALPQHRGYTIEHVMFVVDNNDKKVICYTELQSYLHCTRDLKYQHWKANCT